MTLREEGPAGRLQFVAGRNSHEPHQGVALLGTQALLSRQTALPMKLSADRRAVSWI
jgi:hypothetical protein